MGLLDGRVAIVTGAGNGIGRAEALAFAREGARVVVNDLGGARDGHGNDRSIAQAVVEEITAAGGQAVANTDTVATVEGARAIVQCAIETFGGVDVLVNNAGILRDKSFLKMDDAHFDAVVAVHLKGSFLVAQAAAKRMVEQGRGGSIINTTSMSGMLGNFGQANYAAAKAGVYGLTRTMAIELKKHAIRVNAIAPIARTRMTDDLPMFSAMPDEHFGPQFVAPVAVFLASALSSELSGEVLAVAGAKMSVYRVVESLGVLGEDPSKPWSPQSIGAHWDAIAKL